MASGDEVLRFSADQIRATQDDKDAPAWQLLLAFAVSLLVLCGLIGWLHNVHILTANGMYKSIQAEPWIADPAHAALDPSNYLYFPLYGTLCRLLDWAWHRARRAVAPVRVPQRLLRQPLHGLRLCLRRPDDRQHARRDAGGLLPFRLRLRPAALGDQRRHHAGLRHGAGRDGPGWPVVRPADSRTGRPGRRALHFGLVDRVAADFSDAARLGAGPGAVGGAARAARRADRHADRVDPGRVRDRRAPVAGPQRRRRPARASMDRQGRGDRLGGPLVGQGLDDALGRRQLFSARRRLGRSAVGQARSRSACRVGPVAGGHFCRERHRPCGHGVPTGVCAPSRSSSSARWARAR